MNPAITSSCVKGNTLLFLLRSNPYKNFIVVLNKYIIAYLLLTGLTCLQSLFTKFNKVRNMRIELTNNDILVNLTNIVRYKVPIIEPVVRCNL